MDGRTQHGVKRTALKGDESPSPPKKVKSKEAPHTFEDRIEELERAKATNGLLLHTPSTENTDQAHSAAKRNGHTPELGRPAKQQCTNYRPDTAITTMDPAIVEAATEAGIGILDVPPSLADDIVGGLKPDTATDMTTCVVDVLSIEATVNPSDVIKLCRTMPTVDPPIFEVAPKAGSGILDLPASPADDIVPPSPAANDFAGGLKVGGRPEPVTVATTSVDVLRIPKRPATDYHFFMREMNPVIVRELQAADQFGGGSSKYCGKLNTNAGQKWRNLSPEEKERFKAKAARDKLRYEVEVNLYIAASISSGELSVDKEGEFRRAHKADKDPSAPKPANSGYFQFAKTIKPITLKEFPGMNIVEMGKIFAKRCRVLSPEEKEVYEDMASNDKLRFVAEMESYIASAEESGKLTNDEAASLRTLHKLDMHPSAAKKYMVAKEIAETSTET